MATHTLEVIFNTTPFDECYFTLHGLKTKRLNRQPDNTYRRTWKDLNLEDEEGKEYVKFALSARGVAYDGCSLELQLDGNKLTTYPNLNFAYNGWVTIVDIVKIP
jgi:hypothetical protein